MDARGELLLTGGGGGGGGGGEGGERGGAPRGSDPALERAHRYQYTLDSAAAAAGTNLYALPAHPSSIGGAGGPITLLQSPDNRLGPLGSLGGAGYPGGSIFGRSPLHLEMPGSASSCPGGAGAAVPPLHGWYSSHCPVLQAGHGSSYADLLSTYCGGAGWSSNPGGPGSGGGGVHDYPLSALTHPIWSYPATHYNEGYGGYYPGPNLHSCLSLMSAAAVGGSDYPPPFLSPSGVNASGPRLSPLTYHQRMNDLHKAMLYSSSLGSVDYSSPNSTRTHCLSSAGGDSYIGSPSYASGGQGSRSEDDYSEARDKGAWRKDDVKRDSSAGASSASAILNSPLGVEDDDRRRRAREDVRRHVSRVEPHERSRNDVCDRSHERSDRSKNQSHERLAYQSHERSNDQSHDKVKNVVSRRTVGKHCGVKSDKNDCRTTSSRAAGLPECESGVGGNVPRDRPREVCNMPDSRLRSSVDLPDKSCFVGDLSDDVFIDVDMEKTRNSQSNISYNHCPVDIAIAIDSSSPHEDHSSPLHDRQHFNLSRAAVRHDATNHGVIRDVIASRDTEEDSNVVDAASSTFGRQRTDEPDQRLVLGVDMREAVLDRRAEKDGTNKVNSRPIDGKIPGPIKGDDTDLNESDAVGQIVKEDMRRDESGVSWDDRSADPGIIRIAVDSDKSSDIETDATGTVSCKVSVKEEKVIGRGGLVTDGGRDDQLEIATAVIPSKSMRYQVCQSRSSSTGGSLEGRRVHAITFRPEVGTLPLNNNPTPATSPQSCSNSNSSPPLKVRRHGSSSHGVAKALPDANGAGFSDNSQMSSCSGGGEEYGGRGGRVKRGEGTGGEGRDGSIGEGGVIVSGDTSRRSGDQPHAIKKERLAAEEGFYEGVGFSVKRQLKGLSGSGPGSGRRLSTGSLSEVLGKSLDGVEDLSMPRRDAKPNGANKSGGCVFKNDKLEENFRCQPKTDQSNVRCHKLKTDQSETRLLKTDQSNTRTNQILCSPRKRALNSASPSAPISISPIAISKSSCSVDFINDVVASGNVNKHRKTDISLRQLSIGGSEDKLGVRVSSGGCGGSGRRLKTRCKGVGNIPVGVARALPRNTDNSTAANLGSDKDWVRNQDTIRQSTSSPTSSDGAQLRKSADKDSTSPDTKPYQSTPLHQNIMFSPAHANPFNHTVATFNPAHATSFNPAHAGPFNPAHSTPFSPIHGTTYIPQASPHYIRSGSMSYSPAKLARYDTMVGQQMASLNMIGQMMPPQTAHTAIFNPGLWMGAGGDAVGSGQFSFLPGIVPLFDNGAASQGQGATDTSGCQAARAGSGGYKVAQDSVTGRYYIIPDIMSMDILGGPNQQSQHSRRDLSAGTTTPPRPRHSEHTDSNERTSHQRTKLTVTGADSSVISRSPSPCIKERSRNSTPSEKYPQNRGVRVKSEHASSRDWAANSLLKLKTESILADHPPNTSVQPSIVEATHSVLCSPDDRDWPEAAANRERYSKGFCRIKIEMDASKTAGVDMKPSDVIGSRGERYEVVEKRLSDENAASCASEEKERIQIELQRGGTRAPCDEAIADAIDAHSSDALVLLGLTESKMDDSSRTLKIREDNGYGDSLQRTDSKRCFAELCESVMNVFDNPSNSQPTSELQETDLAQILSTDQNPSSRNYGDRLVVPSYNSPHVGDLKTESPDKFCMKAIERIDDSLLCNRYSSPSWRNSNKSLNLHSEFPHSAQDIELSQKEEFLPSSSSALHYDDALDILSSVAVTQLPLTSSDATAVGGCIPRPRKFSILDIPLSQFMDTEVRDAKTSPDINEGYNAPVRRSMEWGAGEIAMSPTDGGKVYEMTQRQVSDQSMSSMFLHKDDNDLDNMDPTEIEMRLKLASLQAMYRQNQRELARLQRRSSDASRTGGMSSKRHKSRKSSSFSSKRSATTTKTTITATSSSHSDPEIDTAVSPQGQALEPALVNTQLLKPIFGSFPAESSNRSRMVLGDHVFNYTDNDHESLERNERDEESGANMERKELIIRKEGESKGRPGSGIDVMDDGNKLLRSTSNGNTECPGVGFHERVMKGTIAVTGVQKRKTDRPSRLDDKSELAFGQKHSKKFGFSRFESKTARGADQSVYHSQRKRRSSTPSFTHETQDTTHCTDDLVAELTNQDEAQTSTSSKGYLADEWYRCRRSERIFLHDAVAPQHTDHYGQFCAGTGSASRVTLSKAVHRRTSVDNCAASGSGQSRSGSGNRKSSASGRARSPPGPLTLSSRLSGKPGHRYDSSAAMTSSDSDADTDDIPLASLAHKNETPDLKLCMISPGDLVDGVHVLFLKEDLFYESRVKEIEPPDIYGVVIDGERGNKPNIVSREELLSHSVLIVRPVSTKQLLEGARVCAYWSQKFSCLYPGTVRRGKKGSGGDMRPDLVYVQFDDGDRGRIPLEHIRMLPNDFPILDNDTDLLQYALNRLNSAAANERQANISNNISSTLSSNQIAANNSTTNEVMSSGDLRAEPNTLIDTGKTTSQQKLKTTNPERSEHGETLKKSIRTNSPQECRRQKPAASQISSSAVKIGGDVTKINTTLSKSMVSGSDHYGSGDQSKPSCRPGADTRSTVTTIEGKKKKVEDYRVKAKHARSCSENDVYTTTTYNKSKSKNSDKNIASTGQARTEDSKAIQQSKASSQVTLSSARNAANTSKDRKHSPTRAGVVSSKNENVSGKIFEMKKRGVEMQGDGGKKGKNGVGGLFHELNKKSGDNKEGGIEKNIGHLKMTIKKSPANTLKYVENKTIKDETQGKEKRSLWSNTSSSSSSGEDEDDSSNESAASSRSSSTNRKSSGCLARLKESTSTYSRTSCSAKMEMARNSTDRKSGEVERSSSSGESSSSESGSESDGDAQYTRVDSRSNSRQTGRREKASKRRKNATVPAEEEEEEDAAEKKKEEESGESENDEDDDGSEVGAFLPVWDQWQWVGRSTKRPGRKGRARKTHYKAIQRGDEMLKIGDSAVFVSTSQSALQYVGRIESLWETWNGNMVVKVKWFYHPEETKGGKKLVEIKGALYESPHEDENDVQTISHKCRVVSFTEYKRQQQQRQQQQQSGGRIGGAAEGVKRRGSRAGEVREDLFYLAGYYEPIIGLISFETDVKLIH